MSRLSYTGGSDSLVRIWHMDKDQYQEPEVAYEADEGITAIASSVRPFYHGPFPVIHDCETCHSWIHVAPERVLAIWKQRLRSPQLPSRKTRSSWIDHGGSWCMYSDRCRRPRREAHRYCNGVRSFPLCIFQLLTTLSETIIKIVELDEVTNVQVLSGHKKCVRKLTWHPSGTLLVRIFPCTY